MADQQDIEPPRKVHWFRSIIFQVLVIGGVFFCAPGMYNALSALGAGGLATPFYANASAAAGYVFMAVVCITGGIIVSKIGVNIALLIASTGDIVYAGGLYLNSKSGVQWVIMFGSIYSGITDGLMYAVEGPIITSYPEPNRRGRMLALWIFMRSLAPVIGGAIIFAFNNKVDSAGSVSLQTYLTIIGIMCAGPFIALLLSHPEKVQRKDGVKIVFRKTPWAQTMSEWWKIVCSKDILCLCPLFFASWFYGSYIGTLQTQYMNVRTRALCSFMTPFGQMFGGLVIGHFLDWRWLSTKQRARWAFWGLMVLNLALWVWAAIVTKELDNKHPVIDWTSGHLFAATFPLFFLFFLATMATQATCFWIVAQMSDDFISLSYMTGTIRGMECLGQALAYGLKAKNTSDWISIGFNIGVFVVAIPFAWRVVRKIGVVEFEKISYAIEHSKPEEEGSVEEKKSASVEVTEDVDCELQEKA